MDQRPGRGCEGPSGSTKLEIPPKNILKIAEQLDSKKIAKITRSDSAFCKLTKNIILGGLYTLTLSLKKGNIWRIWRIWRKEIFDDTLLSDPCPAFFLLIATTSNKNF